MALLLGELICAHSSEFNTPIAITNVTIIPMPGRRVDAGTILMSGGRIASAGAGVEIPPNAERINGTGLWAYAGFIDAANDVGVSASAPSQAELDRLSDTEQDVGEGPRTAMQKANRNGIWPHRTLEDLYSIDADKLNAYRKAGFTAALVTPRLGILPGQGSVLQLSGDPLRSITIARRVTQFVASSASGASAFGGRGYPSSPMGVVALIRQTFLDAEWYRQRHDLFSRYPANLEQVPADPVLDAMAELIERRQKCLFLANESGEIHHALDLASELNQSAIILGGSEAWKTANRLVSQRVPVIASLDWGKKPELAPAKKSKSSDATQFPVALSWDRNWENGFFEPEAVRRARIREWEDHASNIQRLSDAGVAVALTSHGLKSPDLVWKNLRAALDLGLTPDQLLAALTTGPASIFGLEEQIGTITKGKLGNLTLLTSAIENKESLVRYVFIEGRPFVFPVSKDPSESKKEKDNEAAASEKSKEESTELTKNTADSHDWEFELANDRERPLVSDGNLLLKNATLLTVADGTLHGVNISVSEGRIHAIGPEAEAPPHATTIDLTGYWVMPGIIDPHSHLAVRGVNEGSQSITCEVRQSDVVNHAQLGIHRALAGGVTTIHTMHGSANSIGGQNAVLKLKFQSSPEEMLVTTGPRIVKFALGENVTRARTPARFPNTRMGVESVMRHAFNAALEYRREWETYAAGKSAGEVVELPRRDLRLEALNEIVKGDIWVHSHCYRGDEILRLLTVAEEYGFRVATLQHVLEAYRVLPEMWNHGVGGSTFSDWWSYKKEAFDAIPYNAAMMMRAGIVSSVNSDSAEVIRHLNLEAGKSLRFGGLTADEALRLITINPAIQIGLDKRIGSIEVGKDADFAVFNGHPLDTHARNVMTVIEGEVYFAERGLDIRAMRPGPSKTYIPAPPRPLMNIPRARNGRYAIVGATVHPIASQTITNGVVIMEKGVIRSIDRELEAADDLTVVDAAGLHVYPGLINAATQLGAAEIAAFEQTLDSRDLATFQPELRAISGINPHSEHLPVALCEGITTAHVVPGGGIVSGVGGVIQLSGWSMPEMLREAETGLIVKLPSLPSDLGEDGRDKRLGDHEKKMVEIEAFFRRARHYAMVRDLKGSRFVKDIRLEAMAPYVTKSKPIFFRASSYKEILEAIRFGEVFELKTVILGGGEAWKCADKLAEKGIPVILTEVFSVPDDRFERWDSFYTNAGKLEKAGVLFCIATDGAQFARQLPLQAGMAVAHGLSEARALRAITLDAARILGLETRIGSLESGKVGDVIITNGDPTQASTRTVGCFIAGEPVELTSLHERSYEKFSARPKPGLKPVGDLRGPPPMRIR
ncbi:MAG: amidohydrolase family protein [Verrucomicrobia bacterium]|nr:amidohydrolase family protein [Verrucomicrobiota bacterium]